MSISKEANNDWPIIPRCLIMAEGIDRTNPDYSPNIHGLFQPDELRGFVADASADVEVNNILALFQLIPKGFKLSTEDERIKAYFPKNHLIQKILVDRELDRIVRVYPGRLFPNIECCSFFRECNAEDEDKCFESDSRIALLYDPKLSKLHYDKDYYEFLQTTRDVINNYNTKYINHNNYQLEVVPCLKEREKKRFYIKYKCQYSKLEEFFFPIIYCGKVVAVLMQGQRFPKGLTKEQMFNNCRNKCAKLNESINNLNDSIFNEDPMSDERLLAIVKKIKLLEDKIKKRIDAIVHIQVMKKFQTFEDEFRTQLKQIDEKAIDALEQFKKVLNKTLQRINSSFNSEGFIRIYSIKSKLESVGENVEFDLIGNSSERQDSSKYSKIILKGIKTVNNNIEKDELLKNYVKELPAGFDRDKDILRLIMPFTSQMAYIVWKRYNKWKEDQEDQFTIYATTLKSMYHSLLEPYIILRGIKLEESLETSMRLTVHESAQIIPAVINAINNKESLNTLEDGSQYHGTTFITKPAHAILDVSNRLKVLEGLFRRSTMVLKNDPPSYDWFDLHRIVYATESLFQQRANDNSKQRIIPNFNNELRHYNLLTDYVYLNHILFNLVDNAIKYGLRGSNIYINVDYKCDPFYEQFNKKVINFITIAVKNYGDEIPLAEREKIFELYYRYYKGIKRIEGMGIGLFIAKKLCNLLGYKVQCTDSALIDQYHLPAKFHYINQNEEYNKNKDFSPEVLRLLQKDISNANKKTVINSDIDDWTIRDPELIELIAKPTYCNEFQVTIPIYYNSKNNNLK